MTATYDPALPTNKDKVRFTIGDTGPSFTFQDEEINAVLARTDPAGPPGDPEQGNVYEASLMMCVSGMARSRGSSSSRSIGPMSISDESYDRWKEMYEFLLAAGPGGTGGGVGAGRVAVPRAYGYQPYRPWFDARVLHARIGIHDYASDPSAYSATEHDDEYYDRVKG